MKKRMVGLMMVLVLAVTMLTACGESKILNPDADNMTDIEWTRDICDTGIQKMLDEGAINAPEGDFVFNYTTNGSIQYANEEAYIKYEGNDFKLDGKQIWGRTSDLSLDLISLGKNTSSKGPEYYPDNFYPENTNDNKFADKKSECQYLIVIAGLVTSVNENYYMGNIDRSNLTTFVFIFDAVEKEVIHIEMIGTDSPGMTTDSPVGKTDKDGAIAYINGL